MRWRQRHNRRQGLRQARPTRSMGVGYGCPIEMGLTDVMSANLYRSPLLDKRSGDIWRSRIRDEDGTPEPQTAEYLYLPAIGRIGIAWGADADWADAESVDAGIAMWLNDPEEFAAKN